MADSVELEGNSNNTTQEKLHIYLNEPTTHFEHRITPEGDDCENRNN